MSEDISKQLKLREGIASSMGDGVMQTWGSLDTYAKDLGYPNKESLVKEIEGKEKILDLGSGLGAFAKDSYFNGINTKIYSVNPTLRDETMRGYEKASTKGRAMYYSHKLNYYPYDPTFLDKMLDWGVGQRKSFKGAQKTHDEGAVAAFAHALPFNDDFFDMIIDNCAVFYWFRGDDSEESIWHKPAFVESVKEMLRVLKPGGKIRVSDWGTFGHLETGRGKEPLWKEQVLKDLGIDYDIVWEQDENGYKFPLGIEIRKH